MPKPESAFAPQRPEGRFGRTQTEAGARYMQGPTPRVTSSVLISNSKYLNSPYFRDAFMHQALRRHGHDLPATYMVPAARVDRFVCTQGSKGCEARASAPRAGRAGSAG